VTALRIGLTGGIGAGKSTVLTEFVNLGAIGIDADELAREAVAVGTPGYAQVVDAFGPEVVTADGSLDRERLASVIFADADQRARLEAIVHPLVRARSRELAARAPSDGIVVEAVPLLVETGRAGEYDGVVVVQAPLVIRLRRVLEARNTSHDAAMARAAAQATDDERAQVATWIVVNDGTIEQARERVGEIWQELLRFPV
jgi:dephospho-CoA kinase